MNPLPFAIRCSFHGTQMWGSGAGSSNPIRYQHNLIESETGEDRSGRLTDSHLESSRVLSHHLPAEPAVSPEICQAMEDGSEVAGSSSAPPPIPALLAPALTITATVLRPSRNRPETL